MLLKGIILQSVIHIKGERTEANIYHLLTGKKSIQTVQDAHMYGIDSFFGIHKKLQKPIFDEVINELIFDGYIRKTMDQANRYFLKPTNEAEQWLYKNSKSLTLHYFNGMEYHERGSFFYERLSLLIQTLTNTKESNFSFIPVVDKFVIEQWVKSFYKRVKGKEITFLSMLEKDFVSILKTFSKEEATIFIDRFSGYQHYGKSISQLAEQYGRKTYDVQLLLVKIVHKILSAIEKDKTLYHALNAIIQDQQHVIKLLGSTEETYKLFKQNLSPETIAKIRNLKINTIYDHITEIALYDPYFPFNQFISTNDQQEILEAIKMTNSFKLKVLKEKVNPTISFFQLRLMLILHKKLIKEEIVDAR